MTRAAANGLDERVWGRRWTVRLDAAGRGSAAVRVSCSRPSCAEQRLPSAAAGRAAAVDHLKAHLRALAGPRAGAYCACRAEDCHTHLRPAGRESRTEVWRCGGAIVLVVVTDREGRWWQALECCSRCAAATPGAKVIATAPTPAVPTSADPAAGDRPPAADTSAPQFSDLSSPVSGPVDVPAPRAATVRQRRFPGKIAQRTVPGTLRPVELRDELAELGDLFRAYQQRPEPDLELLAELHARKARAFASWADVTGDISVRQDARRAEQAAAAVRLQHQQRTGLTAGIEESAMARLLPVPSQWEYVRSVLSYAAEHAPLPGPEARLLTLMLTLRVACVGTGNLVGQDVTGLGLADPEGLLGELAGCGWLVLPGTAGDLLASQSENPTSLTVPSLAPREDGEGPFAFGKKTRSKLSGWAQKVVADKKLRKTKATAPVRLLALALAAQTRADGRLGPGGEGIALEDLTTWCPVGPGDLQQLVGRLVAADWLAEADLTATCLTGQLTERVLPLTCPRPR
ncbi:MULTISPECIES: hypothetical protein [unclassified Streptomyces]|uniref:hypothetical protein n=1 Tax=unclassified Streptomyces TaxID=2593676 RepID=UPI0006B01FC2|nr:MULTISPECIES: hypothetical protein [unclassified Streptomyces]KOX25090.1 hypothetical protein ADL06_19365 [Streptomyces sp. NRRL F-6491]KOX37051.1 hypothetical protein ADL08_30655 [Streptomyces sp. NRRL F-6492]